MLYFISSYLTQCRFIIFHTTLLFLRLKYLYAYHSAISRPLHSIFGPFSQPFAYIDNIAMLTARTTTKVTIFSVTAKQVSFRSAPPVKIVYKQALLR